MAVVITVNQVTVDIENKAQSGGGVGTMVIRKTGSGTDTINPATANNAGEIINELTVTEIQWNVASGTVSLNRGANTGVFEGGTSGHVKFDTGMKLEAGGDATADLDIVTAAAGTVLVKCRKKTSPTP